MKNFNKGNSIARVPVSATYVFNENTGKVECIETEYRDIPAIELLKSLCLGLEHAVDFNGFGIEK